MVNVSTTAMTADDEGSECPHEPVSASAKRNILDLTGGEGPWQWRVFIVFFVLSIPGSQQYLVVTFLAPEQENYWCSKPDGAVNVTTEDWVEFGLPLNDKKCSRYETINFTIPLNESRNGTIVPCTSWEFDRSFYTSTLITEWNIVCGKSWLISLSESIFMTGVLVAVVFSGNLSDRVGRRPTITASCVLMALSSLLCAFSSSFWMFLITRFFIAMGVGGYYNNLYVLMTEILSPEKRNFYGNMVQLGWSLGFVSLPGIAWFIRDWFWIQIAASVPALIFLFVWWMIPESPRWLLSSGKTEEARQTLLQAAKMNKIDVQNIDIAIDKIIEESRKGSTSEDSEGKFLMFLKSPGMCQMTLKIYFAWFVIAFTYYGLSLNTNQLAGDPLVNFALSGAVEFPGFLIAIVMIRYCGRRNSIAWALIAGGLVCFASCFVPKDLIWLSVTVSMVGKLCISFCYGVVYVYTPELFPTVVRNTALGGASFFEQIGSIIAPFIRELGEFTNPKVPFVIYGILGATSGIFVQFLPETGDCNVPDTIQEAMRVESGKGNVDLSPSEKKDGKIKTKL